ncbi:MAG TPA: hypothetical protein ENN33_15195 [Ignavibacteria bacterium]|nr:hypothetical protein [Ignavibacteria bacterium]
MINLTKTFKLLEIIFVAFLASQVLLAFLFYILLDMGIVQYDYFDFEYLPIILLVINTMSILSAKYLFTVRKQIEINLTLEEKFAKYRTFSLLIMGILDFTNIINLVFYLLTGSQTYLLVSILILILFTVYRPHKTTFAEISLTNSEKSRFLPD